MAHSNESRIDNIAYIHQLVYELSLTELQGVLEAVKQVKSGTKIALRKRVLNLLTHSLTKTKSLRQKIIHVYKSRQLQNVQSYNNHLQHHQLQHHLPQNQQSQNRHLQHHQPQHLLQRAQHNIIQPTLRQPTQQQHFLQHFLRQPPYSYSVPNNVIPYHETPPNPATAFEHLPFFKNIQTLLTPMYCQSSVEAANFTGLYYLTDSVRHSIVKSWSITKQEYKTQIILRLAQVELGENTTERLPYNITVSVNEHQCKLATLNIPTKAGITPWRCNVPINITAQTDLRTCSQNTLKITWSEEPHQYMAAVFVAQKLTWNELLEELKKRPLRASEITKEFIRKSMENDAEMGIDSMFATVKDPLSKTRMELPARGVNCIHLQCFDAKQFLQMNEQKQTWTCPICKKKVKFESIEMDEFFLSVLQSPKLSEECENIILLKDGSWSEKKPTDYSNVSKISNNQQIEVYTLSDSDDEDIQPKLKRSKCSTPKLEEHAVKSEHIGEIENLKKANCTNSIENDLVLDLSLKNDSPPSSNSEYQPVLMINDDDDILPVMKPHFLVNNFSYPDVSISESNYTKNKPSTSGSNNRHQESVKPRITVITLD